MFITVVFVIAKNWKQSRCLLTDGWINKLHAVHPHHRILLGNKKNEVLTNTTTWMDFEGVMISKKKPKPKGHILYDSTYITVFK